MRKVCFAGTNLSRHNGGIASLSWFCFQLYTDEGNIEKAKECEKILIDLGVDVKSLKDRHGRI